MDKNVIAIGYAIAAAAFYALNVPCSKMLLAHISPVFMAGLLYIGAGLGIGILYLFHVRREPQSERLCKKDFPYTLGMVLLDIAAPILLMFGVKYGTSSNASLLGNFEIVATTLIALFIFREKVSTRLWIAILFITVSSFILSFKNADGFNFSIGSIFVLGATICWGLENNCTRKISDKSTYQIVTIKGLCSGIGSTVVSLTTGEMNFAAKYIPLALLLGFVAYGLSIFTYIRAQHYLGAAKTSAFYAFAPRPVFCRAPERKNHAAIHCRVPGHDCRYHFCGLRYACPLACAHASACFHAHAWRHNPYTRCYAFPFAQPCLFRCKAQPQPQHQGPRENFNTLMRNLIADYPCEFFFFALYATLRSPTQFKASVLFM